MANSVQDNIKDTQNLIKKIKDVNNLIKKIEVQVNDDISGDDNEQAKGIYHIASTSTSNPKEVIKLYNKIKEKNYTVEIIDNIEIKDASNTTKYTIRIMNGAGVYYDISSIKYQESILNPEFDNFEYIEDILRKIEGKSLYTDNDNKNKNENTLIQDIVEYIAIIINDKSYITRVYSVLGFEQIIFDDKTKWIFKYDKLYTDGRGYLAGRLINNDISIGKNQSSNIINEIQWINCIINTMNNHVLDSMLLGAGISGLIRQLIDYSKDSNININICGAAGSGKSTIEHLILSIYGNPQFLEGNFTDTDNAIEQIRGNRPIMPYIIDDMMLKYIADSQQKTAVNLLINIFRESEGRIKERMGYMGEDSGKRTYSAIISSSVESVFDTIDEISNNRLNKDIGQYRRLIEIKIDNKDPRYIIASDKEEAEFIERQSQKNYGYGIYYIAGYLLDMMNTDKNELQQRYNKINRFISSILKDNISASSQRFALIVLSYQILRESILSRIDELTIGLTVEQDEEITGIKENLSEEELEELGNGLSNNIIDQTGDIIRLLVHNLEHKMTVVDTHTNPTNDLKNWITKPENLEYFLQCSNVFDCSTLLPTEQQKDTKKLLGNIKITDDKIEIAFKADYALESILFSPDLDKISIKEFYAFFKQVRNEDSTTARISKYKEYNGYAVEVYGSNSRKKDNKKTRKTPVDDYVYNKDNTVTYEYRTNKGSIYNETGVIIDDQAMTRITIKP